MNDEIQVAGATPRLALPGRGAWDMRASLMQCNASSRCIGTHRLRRCKRFSLLHFETRSTGVKMSTNEDQIKNRHLKPQADVVYHEALRSGQLKAPNTCQRCGASDRQIHGHHEDYAKPLEVIWLCARCHSITHSPPGSAAAFGGNTSHRSGPGSNRAKRREKLLVKYRGR